MGVLCAIYCLVFFSIRLPSIEQQLGAMLAQQQQAGEIVGSAEPTFQRWQILLDVLFPDQVVGRWWGFDGTIGVFDRVPALLTAMLIFAAAVSIGDLLLRTFLRSSRLTRLEHFVFASAIGLNVLSLATLTLGLCHAIQPLWVGRTLIVASLLPGIFRFVAVGRELIQQRRAGVPPESSIDTDAGKAERRWLAGLAVVASVFVALLMLGALTWPAHFDVREYHLQAPKEFFLQGHIGFAPHNVYANMPLGAEMPCLTGMILSGDWKTGALAGKTVIAMQTLLAALALYAGGLQLRNRVAGAIAAVVYLSVPWMFHVSTAGLIDGALALYAFLAVAALWFALREDFAMRWYAIAGFMAGGAVACKYPAVLFVVFPLACTILFRDWLQAWLSSSDASGDAPAEDARPSKKRKKSSKVTSTEKPLRLLAWKPLAVFLVGTGIACGPWLVKNAVLTGNPTYPLLYGVFGDRTDTWDAEKDARWNRVHRAHDFAPTTLAKDAGRVTLTSEWLSPLILPLALLALIRRDTRRLAIPLLAYVGFVLLCWWMLTHRLDRFWLLLMPMSALLAGLGATWSWEKGWRGLLAVLLAVGGVYCFLTVSRGWPGQSSLYLMPLDAQETLLADPWTTFFNDEQPETLMLIGEADVFDYDVPIVYNTCFDDAAFERIAKDQKPEEVRRQLQQEGISHILVDWSEIARYRSPGNYGYTEFVQPEAFTRLVDAGVLEPIEPIDGSSAWAFRVR